VAGKNTGVFGIYPTHSSLEIGVQALKDAGFQHTEISVLYPEDLGIKDADDKNPSKAPEGAATGASAGAVVGGVLGWLAGIGTLIIPGMGPFIAAGPIVAALVGAGAGGTLGGVAGGLAGLGLPETEAHHYQERVREGGTLLYVYGDNSYELKRAEEILERTGAQEISTIGEAGAGFDQSVHPLQRSASDGEPRC
jgi:hypothetical protein